MDSRTTGEFIAQSVPLVVSLAVTLVAVRRARRQAVRSRRLSGLALACGLAVLPLLCVSSLVRNAPFVFFVLGAATLAASSAAIALSFVARVVGKAEGHNSGGFGAIVLGLLGAVLGFGMIMLPLMTESSVSDSSAQSHRIEPLGFEVSLPTPRWQRFDRSGDVAAFASRTPQMVCSVREVRPAPSVAAFEAIVGDAKRLTARAPAFTVIEEKREPNANGHEHWRLVGEENGSDGRIVVAMSVTWWKESHAVTMLFEGQYRMASRVAQNQESEAFISSARFIVSSVK